MSNRADIDPVLDDLIDDELGWAPDEWDDRDREDIVYGDIQCRDCGSWLPLSYRRGDDEDYYRSLRASGQSHICAADPPDVIIITASGQVYSMEEYLDR